MIPVAGDWNADGIDTVGIYDRVTGTFSLINENKSTAQAQTVSLGGGSFLPLSGHWGEVRAR
jgi:hypothetical protein